MLVYPSQKYSWRKLRICSFIVGGCFIVSDPRRYQEVKAAGAKPKALGKAVFPAPIKHKEPQLLLAQKHVDTNNVDNYWISEKLDGVRAYFDHTLGVILSRLGFVFLNPGNEFPCPDWFLKGFPKDMSLDGELYMGRNRFQETIETVKDPQSPNWSKISFWVFDAPSVLEPFEERRSAIADYFIIPPSTHDARCCDWP